LGLSGVTFRIVPITATPSSLASLARPSSLEWIA
jgi:hypothetical protein